MRDRKQIPVVEANRPQNPNIENSDPDPQVQMATLMVDREREAVLSSLTGMSRIVNDEGVEVDFDGEVKDIFIDIISDGFDVLQRIITCVYENGEFLTEARKELKPRKLFLTWLNYVGLHRSTAYQYITLYERYREELHTYYPVGVKKLLAVAQIKDCKGYLRENVEEIMSMPASDVVQKVKEELGKGNKKRRVGRKPKFEVVNDVIIRQSGNGTKIVVEQLPQNAQEKIVAAIKAVLLQIKP